MHAGSGVCNGQQELALGAQGDAQAVLAALLLSTARSIGLEGSSSLGCRSLLLGLLGSLLGSLLGGRLRSLGSLCGRGLAGGCSVTVPAAPTTAAAAAPTDRKSAITLITARATTETVLFIVGSVCCRRLPHLSLSPCSGFAGGLNPRCQWSRLRAALTYGLITAFVTAGPGALCGLLPLNPSHKGIRVYLRVRVRGHGKFFFVSLGGSLIRLSPPLNQAPSLQLFSSFLFGATRKPWRDAPKEYG